MVKKVGGKKVSQVVTKQKVAAPWAAEFGSSLASMIDPLLLAGGMTVKEIAAELAKKAAEATKDKDLSANVRARMVSYTRKGWQVIKDDEKHVQVVQKKG